jgi:hypothetical protein
MLFQSAALRPVGTLSTAGEFRPNSLDGIVNIQAGASRALTVVSRNKSLAQYSLLLIFSSRRKLFR